MGSSERNTEAAGASPARQRKDTERHRMTVVDDSDAFVGLVAEVVADRFVVTGIKPRSLDDIAKTEPDVLMVDLNPRDGGPLNGWHLIEGARAHDALREVPIILCSGAVDANGEVERALRHPAVQLLAKPFALDAFDETLARALSGDAARNGNGIARG